VNQFLCETLKDYYRNVSNILFEFERKVSQTRTFKFAEFKNSRISDKDNPCLGYPSLLHTLSKQLSMSVSKFMMIYSASSGRTTNYCITSRVDLFERGRFG
jgi:hypothetical protein